MLFINTRPASRAKPLSEYLQQHGIDVIELPLLELVETLLTADEITALKTVNACKAVILVSEEAVKYGLSQLTELQDLSKLSNAITWLAVGEKTADFFIKSWQQVSDVPPPVITYPLRKAEQNNEGMLALPIMQSLNMGDKVQLWRGLGGRELLADTLTAKGIQVDLLNFYQRILPVSTIDKFARYQTDFDNIMPIVVLISSLTAWQHWCELINQYQLSLSQFRYLVLQSRIAAVIGQQLDNTNLGVMINDLQPTTILAALTA